MAFIKINNDDLQVLIDDEYENYVFAGKFVVNLAFDSINSEKFGSFTYTGHANSAPLVAVLIVNGEAPVFPTSITRSGNTFTIKVNTYRAWPGLLKATLLVYDRPAETAGTGLVVVRNAANRVTFDSDLKYMKVINVFQMTGDVSIARPQNKEIAILFASPWLYYSRFFVRYPNGDTYYGAQFDTLLHAVVTASEIQFSRRIFFYSVQDALPLPPGWGDFATLSPGNYIMLDATGDI